MTPTATLCTALSALAIAVPAVAAADMVARFSESAPKDRFRIVNTSDCATGAVTVTIDLSGSDAGLIFDTTGSGAGVSVFQPFELISGGDYVTGAAEITDGDTRAVLRLSDLPPGGVVAFTIDVDDTLPSSRNGQTMIAGGEIAGARLLVGSDTGAGSQGAFGTDGTATASWQACLS